MRRCARRCAPMSGRGARLRSLAASADNSSAAVGAVRAAVAVADGRLNVLIMAGVLLPPETAYVMRARALLEEEKQRFARDVLDAIERRGIDPGQVLTELGAARELAGAGVGLPGAGAAGRGAPGRGGAPGGGGGCCRTGRGQRGVTDVGTGGPRWAGISC